MRGSGVLLAATLLASPATGAPPPATSGGGEYRLDHVPHLTAAQRREIHAELASSIARLTAEGKRQEPDRLMVVALGWPLQLRAGLTDFGYHGISNFVDQNRASGSLLDHECRARTYDNHAGIDLFTWPFPWNKMDADEVEIVAAADGMLLGKSNGNSDRSCAAGGGMWNAVYVEHADGSIAWYGHMKNGSPTSKIAGDPVVEGEVLGIVGSSGNSTGPHLHLELYDSAGGNLVDPYFGPCNTLNPTTWWAAQRPYYDSAVNKLTTGRVAPDLSPPCPSPSIPNEELFFIPGETIYFARYYRDQLGTQDSVQTIYRPNGSVFATWTDRSPVPHYAASWWWNSRNIGLAEPPGTWRFVVDFEGVRYEHEFYLIGAASPWLLRNADLTDTDPLSAALSTIFVGSGSVTLDLMGGNLVADEGEGDDDDAYVRGFVPGEDPDPDVVTRVAQPLVFYQVSEVVTPILLARTPANHVAITY